MGRSLGGTLLWPRKPCQRSQSVCGSSRFSLRADIGRFGMRGKCSVPTVPSHGCVSSVIPKRQLRLSIPGARQGRIVWRVFLPAGISTGGAGRASRPGHALPSKLRQPANRCAACESEWMGILWAIQGVALRGSGSGLRRKLWDTGRRENSRAHICVWPTGVTTCQSFAFCSCAVRRGQRITGFAY